MAVLDESGLNYFYRKIKSKFALSSHSHNAVSTSDNGFMSSTDKSKLDNIAAGATKNTIIQTTVTLVASNWSNNSQAVTVNGVTGSSLIFVEVSANNSNGVICTSQATNKLTFTCDNVPTNNVTVQVAVIT